MALFNFVFFQACENTGKTCHFTTLMNQLSGLNYATKLTLNFIYIYFFLFATTSHNFFFIFCCASSSSQRDQRMKPKIGVLGTVKSITFLSLPSSIILCASNLSLSLPNFIFLFSISRFTQFFTALGDPSIKGTHLK